MVRVYAYRIFLIVLLVGLTILGIFIGFQLVKNEPLKEMTPVVNNEEDEVEVYTPVVSKTYDIELIYEDYYSECKESIINKSVAYGVTLDELKTHEKEKQEKLGEQYEIKEESNQKLIYFRTISGYCPNHFKLILNDKQNKVLIYNLEEEDSVYKEIQVYKNTLREELLKQLEEGIEVDSIKELNLIIEDIES